MRKYLSYAYSIEPNLITIWGINDTGKHTHIVDIKLEGVGCKDTKDIHTMVKTIMQAIYGQDFKGI